MGCNAMHTRLPVIHRKRLHETSVNFYHTIQCHITENSTLHSAMGISYPKITGCFQPVYFYTSKFHILQQGCNSNLGMNKKHF